MRRHGFAVVLALAAGAVLLGLAAATAGERAPAGRVLALAMPWERDVEVAGRLAASGAEWVLPLWLPGAWLAEMRPGGPPRGFMLFPIGEGWAWLPGCAPARPAPRSGAGASGGAGIVAGSMREGGHKPDSARIQEGS